MNFLKDLDFDDIEIKNLDNNIDAKIINLLQDNEKVVCVNLLFLKKLGVKNYKDVFSKFYDMFLLDASVFKNIFDKYEKEDLVNKIAKNVNIVEYL